MLKKGDYVLCYYEGKEYTGLILDFLKRNMLSVQICTSTKRAEKPILEQIIVSEDNVKPIKKREVTE